MNHPLLNPDSKHYQMIDGVESIERLEEMYTQDELATWAKVTAMKYRLRIGNKDGAEQEVVKIKTYEAYYTFLTTDESEIPHDPTQAELDEFRHDLKEPEVDVNEDLYNVCESHLYDCECPSCIALNIVGEQLSNVKRKYQYHKRMSDEIQKGQILFVINGKVK